MFIHLTAVHILLVALALQIIVLYAPNWAHIYICICRYAKSVLFWRIHLDTVLIEGIKPLKLQPSVPQHNTGRAAEDTEGIFLTYKKLLFFFSQIHRFLPENICNTGLQLFFLPTLHITTSRLSAEKWLRANMQCMYTTASSCFTWPVLLATWAVQDVTELYWNPYDSARSRVEHVQDSFQLKKQTFLTPWWESADKVGCEINQLGHQLSKQLLSNGLLFDVWPLEKLARLC